MKITVLSSAENHHVYPRLQRWVTEQGKKNDVELLLSSGDVQGGDLLLLISCNEMIKRDIRNKYKATLVIHASDLPKGRGWSPHIWNVIQGGNELVVTLLEAEDGVDTGDIWSQVRVPLEGHELYDEINDKLFDAEISLMDFAVQNFGNVEPVKQPSEEATYFPKRTPADSELDVDKTIADLFDILRVADPVRYPAYFVHRGYKYKVVVSKIGRGE